MKNFKLLSGVLAILILLVLVSCQKDGSLDQSNPIDEIVQQENPAVRACGMEAHMQELKNDPEYLAYHEKKLERSRTRGSFRADCTEKVIIPVAVHFQRNRKGDINCLRTLAQNQVDILNADYGGTNFDISNWTNGASALFPGVNNGEACIEFCIATKNHPSGYGLSEGDPAVTLNATSGDTDSNWSGYLNIFVKPIRYLGYSPLGGRGNGDGVVIDDNAFGSTGDCTGAVPSAPYNLGRTLTHELGHYLLLPHIWGGGCGSDDGVGDTPDSSGPYYGCPSNGASTCGSTDMHMNYMDYVDDRCMYMFSEGQATIMENYVGSDLSALVANASIVCGDSEPPCTDCDDCVVPTGLNASVNKKKVNLSWDAQDNTTYDVRYRKIGDSWTTVSSNNNVLTLNGVKGGSYEFQVRAKCGSSTTAYSTSSSFNV